MASPQPRQEVQVLLAYLANTQYPAIESQTPPEARNSMVAGLAEADLPAGEIAVARELSMPGPGGALRILLLDARPQREASPVMVWFHGGGFVTGGVDTHRSFAADLARQLDAPVALVDYRLAPEAPYPAAVNDAEAAARWLADAPPAVGFRITGLVLGGDSVGGAMAAATAMALRDAPDALPVLAQLLIYPALDYTRPYASEEEFGKGYLMTSEGNRWYQEHYKPKVDEVRASPMLGRLDGLPPTVLLAAEMDLFRDQARAFAAGLVKAGTATTYLEAKGMIHAFVLLRKVLPSVRDDIARAVQALRSAAAYRKEAGKP